MRMLRATEIRRLSAMRWASSIACASSSTPVEKIGFLGIGEMGSRMVANLLTNAGQEVVVCDDRAQALHEASELGAETVSTPAALASTEGVRVIISMLPSAKSMRDAYLGRDGVVKAEGGCIPSLFIDCSTAEPADSRRLGDEIRQSGTLHHDARPFADCSAARPAFLDVPVSGGVAAAKSGTLTFMVGGAKPAAKAAETYLKMLGKHVLYCGEQGSGQAAKACVDLALSIQMASIAESMAHGITLGLDPRVMANVLNASSSRCWSSSDYNPVPGIQEGTPAARDFKGGFKAADMVEALRAVMKSREEAGVSPLPMTKQALELYSKVAEQHPKDDFSSIYKHLYQ